MYTFTFKEVLYRYGTDAFLPEQLPLPLEARARIHLYHNYQGYRQSENKATGSCSFLYEAVLWRQNLRKCQCQS